MEQKEIILFLIIFSITIAIFIAAIFIFIIFYRNKVVSQFNEKEHMKSEHQKELFATQLEIQVQTMQHIGREIHDNIGQKLTLASLYTQQLAYENKAPHINENIENIGTIINQSLTELRELSKSLTNNAIDNNSISELLKVECNKINESKICTVHFKSNAEKTKLSYQTKSVLLRVSQEFMQNSIKHANCKNITVSLGNIEEKLRLTLEDDGKGFDADKNIGNGIGLSNMKKRAEIIGGNYDLKSNSTGTKLVIEIPVKS